MIVLSISVFSPIVSSVIFLPVLVASSRTRRGVRGNTDFTGCARIGHDRVLQLARRLRQNFEAAHQLGIASAQVLIHLLGQHRLGDHQLADHVDDTINLVEIDADRLHTSGAIAAFFATFPACSGFGATTALGAAACGTGRGGAEAEISLARSAKLSAGSSATGAASAGAAGAWATRRTGAEATSSSVQRHQILVGFGGLDDAAGAGATTAAGGGTTWPSGTTSMLQSPSSEFKTSRMAASVGLAQRARFPGAIDAKRLEIAQGRTCR